MKKSIRILPTSLRESSLMLLIVAGACLSSCNDRNDEFDDKGSSQVTALNAPPLAYMGDSIQFSYGINASGARPNQSKLQLYIGDELASERIMLTPQPGEYKGKLFIPFRKNLADQDVTIKLRIQNELFANATAQTTMKIERPKFTNIYFEAADGTTYPMTLADGSDYTYTTGDQPFPGSISGVFRAAAYGDNGNEIIFGNADGKIMNGITDPINFTTGEDNPDPYPICFNTFNYEGSPFVKFAVNINNEVVEFDGNGMGANQYKADINIKQGADLYITGLKKDEYADYWINPAFLDKVKGYDNLGGEGSKLRWRAKDGRYRIICDKGFKYFRIYPLNAAGNGMADRRNGDDVFWIIGNNGVGFPSYAQNNSNWNTSERKSIALAPVADNVYEVVFQGGVTINPNSINWKLFWQAGWGTETGNSDYQTLVCEGLPVFDLAAQSDNGNVGKGSYTMKQGYYYRVHLDMTSGKFKWTCEELETLPEVE